MLSSVVSEWSTPVGLSAGVRALLTGMEKKKSHMLELGAEHFRVNMGSSTLGRETVVTSDDLNGYSDFQIHDSVQPEGEEARKQALG